MIVRRGETNLYVTDLDRSASFYREALGFELCELDGIDVVVVGDRPTDENIDGLIAAAGEAMVNAARHSGASRVSVYVEAGSAGIEAWITDQGSGFDAASVPSDRRGITESIRARMERIGGSAEITSTTGEGTEVKLTLEYR